MSSTLPSHFRRPKSAEKQLPFPTLSSTVDPEPVKPPFLYHDYFCQDPKDSQWTEHLMNVLENEHKFICAEYMRDFTLGEMVLDIMTSFIFTSQKIVMVLSENFLKSKWAQTQLSLALHYDVDHEINNIVVLHIDECVSPLKLLPFERISTSNEDWMDKFVQCLLQPTQPMQKEICTDGSHVSVKEICETHRSVMSDPPTLNRSRQLAISDNTRLKIWIWHKRKSLNKLKQGKELCPDTFYKQDKPQNDLTDVSSQDDLHGDSHDDLHDSPGDSHGPAGDSHSDSRHSFGSPGDSHDSHGDRVLSVLKHAMDIRSKNKCFYESNESILAREKGGFVVGQGDVLERLHDEPVEDSLYRCKNAQGQVGLIPKGLVSPCWYVLPSQLVKQFQQPISPRENDAFKENLEGLGMTYSLAIETKERPRTDGIRLSIRKGDVLLKISTVTAGRARFKNCRNETGYVCISSVRDIEVRSILKLDRGCNTSQKSTCNEGLCSETADV